MTAVNVFVHRFSRNRPFFPYQLGCLHLDCAIFVVLVQEGKVEIESEESEEEEFDAKEFKKILKTKNQNIVKI